MIVPCHRGGHHCSWPACSLDCDGRLGDKGDTKVAVLYKGEMIIGRKAFEEHRASLLKLTADYDLTFRINDDDD